MQWYERLLHNLGLVKSPEQPIVPIDSNLMAALDALAEQEDRELADLTAELLHIAVAERSTAIRNLQRWQDLTPREKQTAALACLGYTNQEIAARMVISPNTVKTHMRHVLNKFAVNSKAELRVVLSGWDFREWVERQDLWDDDALPPINGESPDGVTP